MNRAGNKFILGKRATKKDTISNLYKSGQHAASFGGVSTLRHFFKKASNSTIDNVLQSSDTYSRHKPNKPVQKHNPIYVRKKRFRLQGDLAEFQGLQAFNADYRYILVLIDGFTKRTFLAKLKTKRQEDILDAFKKIVKKMGPLEDGASICYDLGSEFNNQLVKDYLKLINLEVIHSKTNKCYIVERVILSLKRLIMQYITEEESRSFMHNLSNFEGILNNRHHRSLGMSPMSAEKDENRQFLVERNQMRYNKLEARKRKIPRFKVGQKVRISNQVDYFRRGFDETHKQECFKVSKVLVDKPITTYELTEYNGDPLVGLWYERELTEFEGSIFKLKEILKKRNRPGQETEYFVSWLGYPDKYNSWIAESQLEKTDYDKFNKKK
jgi:hypothetical protein